MRIGARSFSQCSRRRRHHGSAVAALLLVAHVAGGASAQAEPLDGGARAAAAYLPLGASASLALRTSSEGSALARVMHAQGQPISDLLAPARVGSTPSPRVGPGLRSEPDLFGSTALRVGDTALSRRWRQAIAAPLPRSTRWKREVRAIAALPMSQRLERANSWVNRNLQFTSDEQIYGEADHWAGAGEALSRGRGDCEDYALAKLQLLRAAGVPPSQLYLVIVRDAVRRSDHAVLAVRVDGRFLVLDNSVDRVLEAAAVRDYTPVITFGAAGTWAHGFRERAPLRLADSAVATPAAEPPS